MTGSPSLKAEEEGVWTKEERERHAGVFLDLLSLGYRKAYIRGLRTMEPSLGLCNSGCAYQILSPVHLGSDNSPISLLCSGGTVVRGGGPITCIGEEMPLAAKDLLQRGQKRAERASMSVKALPLNTEGDGGSNAPILTVMRMAASSHGCQCQGTSKFSGRRAWKESTEQVTKFLLGLFQVC